MDPNETMTEALAAWLRTAPALADLRALWVDDLPAAPCCAGLFPAGSGVTARRENLLGQRFARCRARWTLRLVLPHGTAGAPANARRLEALADWTAAQSAAGLAPRFGNADPAAETLTAAGGLEKTGDEGTATYAVTLTAEYTRQLC